MKKIPFIGWVMLIGTGVPAAMITWVMITSDRYDLGDRIMGAAWSISVFLIFVGMCVCSLYQQKKREGQSKNSGGK